MTQTSPSQSDDIAEDSVGWQHNDGVWWLLASRCEGCDNRAFPAAEFCHLCGSDRLVGLPIAPRGSVYSWTRVFVAPAEFQAPYYLAYIDLEDGPRILGRLHDADPPAIGDLVEGAPAVVGAGPEGASLTAARFSPVRREV